MRQPTNHNRPAKRKPERRSRAAAVPNHPRRGRPKGELPKPFNGPAADPMAFGKQRIAKVIARAGLCSRRDAEAWIKQGRVSVNGTMLTSPALNVEATDQILVDGAPLAARERTRLFLFHKPRGYVTTSKDPQNRPTVFDLLPRELPRLVSIGRLDINTQGLLLLTNDGGLARVLELPQTGWLRRYRVRANGMTDQAALDKLAAGITLDGMNYGPIEAKFDRLQGANVWLTMGLREGKNREVKRVLESLGLFVNRLIRTSFGPFQLRDLAEGAVEEVNERVLKEQLGEALTRAAHADFESPKMVAPARVERRLAKPAAAVVEPEAPRRERPQKAKRKHISVLRAERRASALRPRTVERDATADRKGREIEVERLVAVSPKRQANKSRAAVFSAPRSTPSRSARHVGAPDRAFSKSQRPPQAQADARPTDPRERSTNNGRPAFKTDAAAPVARSKRKKGNARFDKAARQHRETATDRAAVRVSGKPPRPGKDETRSRPLPKGRRAARPGRNDRGQSGRATRPSPPKRPGRTPP
jgi:23S rRNA pseudouridine2605 synthase